MNYKTPEFIHRKGVVLSHDAVPYDSALTFNAGVVRRENDYVMLFRNDYGFSPKDFEDFYAGISDNRTPKTNIGAAYSPDGMNWEVYEKPVFSLSGNGITRAYDPRITVLDNSSFGVCFAVDSQHGIRGGIAVTKDFEQFDIKSISVPVNRNMVLFPERIGGEYIRLERPFLTNNRNHSIWLSRSPDLIHWGESELVVASPDIPFANLKIGPGAPPVKTPQGWLTLFHAVETQETPFNAWQRDWIRAYYTGIMLLDPVDPAKIIALAGIPLIVPEEKYEMEGFRGGVVFPGALIPEADGMAKIYYGAADTVECLAEAKMDDLIEFCFRNNIINI